VILLVVVGCMALGWFVAAQRERRRYVFQLIRAIGDLILALVQLRAAVDANTEALDNLRLGDQRRAAWRVGVAEPE